MDEHDEVEDTEFVYRRIHRTFFDSNLPIPIRSAAFRPNVNDTKGLSVFRASIVTPKDTLLNIEPVKAQDYYVARLSVKELRKLGLTVVADPVPGGPLGHAAIPELSWH